MLRVEFNGIRVQALLNIRQYFIEKSNFVSNLSNIQQDQII